MQLSCLQFPELFVGFRQLEQSFYLSQSSIDPHMTYPLHLHSEMFHGPFVNHSESCVCFTPAIRADADETIGRFLLPGLGLFLHPFLL